MKKTINTQVTLEGLMTFSKLETGLRTADFECCDDVETEAFVGRFRVQGMHDGNVYMTEMPKRVRNHPLFRQENSTLTLGQNGMYYFVFRLPESEAEELPGMLVKEARQAATKLVKMF